MFATIAQQEKILPTPKEQLALRKIKGKDAPAASATVAQVQSEAAATRVNSKTSSALPPNFSHLRDGAASRGSIELPSSGNQTAGHSERKRQALPSTVNQSAVEDFTSPTRALCRPFSKRMAENSKW